MRVALTILIAVTQLAGPWLCCCGPERIVAAFASTKPVVATPAPVSPTTSHCPLYAKTADAKTLPDSPSAPKPSKPMPPERCPCGGVELLAVLPTPTGDTPAFDLDRLVLVAAEVSVPLSVEPLPPVNRTGLRELPFLTTVERLYAHHVLRC
jgi:hypothetical protein